MFSIFFLLFLALFLSLLIYPFQKGNRGIWSRIFRIVVVVISVIIFGYYFIIKSLNSLKKDVLTVQIINKTPLPLDFYLLKINGNDNKSQKNIETRPVGIIRSDHFRMEYLDVENSNEFWIVGFLGKKNRVYFSQHSLAQKNVDQNIEVKNYLNQSEKLSKIAQTKIDELRFQNRQNAIWITLDLLLLFLNLVLIFRKKSYEKEVKI